MKNVTPNHPFSTNLPSLKNSLFNTLNIAPHCFDIKVRLEMERQLELNYKFFQKKFCVLKENSQNRRKNLQLLEEICYINRVKAIKK